MALTTNVITRGKEDRAAHSAPNSRSIETIRKFTARKNIHKMNDENENIVTSFQKENEEEDEIYKKATRHACWNALTKLREDRMKIWHDFLPDEEDANVPDEPEFNKLWNEEIERSRIMLEALYPTKKAL